jgi:hypothetical protein
MRWFKFAAIAGGILIAFLVVGSVIGFIIHAVTTLVREEDSHQSLPRAEVDTYSSSVPAQQPRRNIPSTADIDDELARLKREMGS